MNDLENIFPKYTDSEIEKFDSEDKFMDASVELLKQTIELIYRVVWLKYCDIEGMPNKIDKDEAVVGGNLVRLIKLNTSFLQNICEGKLEICYIINRCIAETAINTKFLIIEGEDRVRRNYIKHSLITEKELWQTILSNVKDRDDNILPIEERMQKSIRNSFDQSDFDLDEVKRSSKWKSIKDRANLVAGDMFYSVFYGISSHSVHGNWQDILSNNLKKREDGFELNLQWNRPRPQIIDGSIVLNLDIVKVFCERDLKNDTTADLIITTFKKLKDYHSCLTQLHEKWMSK